MSKKIKERRRWINKQPSKRFYLEGKGGDLRTCLLCGNRYPFTDKRFHPLPKHFPNLHGFAHEGLMQICNVCSEDWGPDLREDVNALAQEAKELRERGDNRPIKPLARRKKG